MQALIDEQHICPVPIDGALRYSFHDLLVLRSASNLRRARVPTRKIREALRQLRQLGSIADLPTLTRAPTGRGIAISAGANLWAYDSGQYALPLAQAHVLSYAAAEHYERAHALEVADPAGACTAYAACLALVPDYIDARINLGLLLHRAGELSLATHVYRDVSEPDARLLMHFAAVLEDQNRCGEALEKYRHAVALDPQLAERYAAPASSLRPLCARLSH